MTAPSHLVLVGMMGAGKSSVGRALAARLGVAYADNDAVLRSTTGHDALSTARGEGVAALHHLEHDLLAAALARPDRAIVAAAASVALDPTAPKLLGGQRVVWLRARPATLMERVRQDPVRPLLGDHPEATLEALAAEREPGFARLADVVVDVDGLSVAEIVDRVVEAVGATAVEALPKRGREGD